MTWQERRDRFRLQAAMALSAERIAMKLVELREREGHEDRPGKPMAVETAAERAGVRMRTWQRWEAGETTPYARNLSAIIEAFKLPADYFEDTATSTPPETPERHVDLLESLGELRASVEQKLDADAIVAAVTTGILSKLRPLIDEALADALAAQDREGQQRRRSGSDADPPEAPPRGA